MTDAGRTVLVSTHYMEEAEYCHRLALMNRGRLIALDTPSGVRGRLQQPLLELAVSDVTGAVQVLQDAPGVQEAGIFGRTVHLVVDDAALVQRVVESRLSDKGIALQQIQQIPPTLEDVFIALVDAEGGAASN
jgi:ABC-2 type transport system ATP-binding protein